MSSSGTLSLKYKEYDWAYIIFKCVFDCCHSTHYWYTLKFTIILIDTFVSTVRKKLYAPRVITHQDTIPHSNSILCNWIPVFFSKLKHIQDRLYLCFKLSEFKQLYFVCFEQNKTIWMNKYFCWLNFLQLCKINLWVLIEVLSQSYECWKVWEQQKKHQTALAFWMVSQDSESNGTQ